MNLKMLEDVLDPGGESLDAVLDWVNGRIEAIRKTAFTPEAIETFASVELKEEFVHSFGMEASSTWRRFFLATLLADWASYEKPVDRADFARLKYIMTSAYRYTRLWGCRLADRKFTPVGYTAWYPIAKFVFDGALDNQAEIDDRGIILPLRFASAKNIRYGYVFNFSIAKELRHSSCSKKLLHSFLSDKAFASDIEALMIAVSPEGRKFAERMRFVSAGDIKVQGETETLYVRHPRS
jgi:hypothetical protein